MNETQLAIASVPVQKWSSILSEQEALSVGTIFPELDKPFYCGEKGKSVKKELSPREKMMQEIQEVSFALDDLRLYMDTHPHDTKALEVMKNKLKKRKELLKNFALQFYPLTMDCMADVYEGYPDSECYCWGEGPIPWEGACI